jgi:hypothetical protein
MVATLGFYLAYMPSTSSSKERETRESIACIMQNIRAVTTIQRTSSDYQAKLFCPVKYV